VPESLLKFQSKSVIELFSLQLSKGRTTSFRCARFSRERKQLLKATSPTSLRRLQQTPVPDAYAQKDVFLFSSIVQCFHAPIV